MWDFLEVSIPAVVLIPVMAIGVVLWFCLQQNARSSDVRRAEFQRLQRLAMEEHDRAERELERDYMRHKPQGVDSHGGVDPRGGGLDPHGVDMRRRGAPGNGYGNDRVDEWRPDPEIEARRRRQAEEEEQRRKQAEAEFNRRKQAEAEEFRRKQAEEAEFRRKQEEIADRKRKENLEAEMRRRQAEDQEWQRRRADLEAQARRDAEEERRRQAAEQVEKQRRWKLDEAHKQEMSPRRVVPPMSPMSSLTCVVCQKPTKVKRRCSRCKSMNYCSRECQVQHWNDGHKLECRPHDTSASPRGSVDGDTRSYSDFNSPRS